MTTTIPFSERFTCSISDACDASGLGRSKLYEEIAAGRLETTTVGKRRLVYVRSLLGLLAGDETEAGPPANAEPARKRV